MASLSELAASLQTSPQAAMRQEDISYQQYQLQQGAIKQAQQDQAQQMPKSQGLGGMTGVGANGAKPQALGQMAGSILSPDYKLTTPDGELTTSGLYSKTMATAQTESQQAQKALQDANYYKAMGKDKEAQVADMEARRLQTASKNTEISAQKIKTDGKDDLMSSLYRAKSQTDFDQRRKDGIERTGVPLPKDFPTTWTPDLKEKFISKMSPTMRQKMESEDLAEAASKRAEKRADLQNQHLVALIRNGQDSGKESPQATRVIQAFTQASDALTNIARLPISTTGPMFLQKQFNSLLTAPLSALNQEMSDTTSQKMQTRMVGVARSLASLESGGAATGLVGLANSIESGVAIPANAKLDVAMDKLAEMRRIVESSSEAQLSDKNLSEDRKNLIRNKLELVRKAIPFTQEQLDDAASAAKDNPDLTFTEFASQKYGAQKTKGTGTKEDPIKLD